MNFLRNIRFLFLNIGILLMVKIGYSQNADFQTWHAIEVEKKIVKDFSIAIEEEIRIFENSTTFNESNTSISGLYSINKLIKAGLGYRYSYTFDYEEGYLISHRVMADGNIKYKLGDFMLSFRERFQCDWQSEKTSATATYAELYLRHKFQVRYNVPKISLFPYIEAELFQSLNNPIQNKVDKYRWTIGLQYKFENDLSVSLYYRIQDSHRVLKKRNEIFILGTGISYEF